MSHFPGCDGAPLLPLLYIATNLAFNISVLNVVKISSAVVSSLTVMLSGILSFTFLLYVLCSVNKFTGKTIVFYRLFANGCFC
jgi:hypothetical protein